MKRAGKERVSDLKIKKEFIKREIGGESFLVPMGKTVYDSNGLYALTELGGYIWDLLPQAESQEDILAAVLRDYEVTEEVARADIAEFFGKLQAMGII